mgnify:CR=1 FL=1
MLRAFIFDFDYLSVSDQEGTNGLNFASANGSERSNVDLPQFYNDQFNTTTVDGRTVVTDP